jgi:beta-phosphoglucomutase-like phosphatase (HAD superfamily)
VLANTKTLGGLPLGQLQNPWLRAERPSCSSDPSRCLRRLGGSLAQSLKDSGVEALLLDLDGCLWEQGVWPHLVVAMEVLNSMGQKLTWQECRDRYVDEHRHGMDWFKLMAGPDLSPDSNPDWFEEFKTRVAAVSATLQTPPVSPIPVFDGVLKFLAEARSVFGRKNIAAVTATPTSLAQACLYHARLSDYVGLVHGCENLWVENGEVRNKTWAGFWEEPARMMGVTLPQCAVAEDGKDGATFALTSEVGAFLALSPRLFPLIAQHPRKRVWQTNTIGGWLMLNRCS